MRTLTCKHKIWGENWLYLRPYFKPVFNVLETCREYLLTIDREIKKENLSSGLLKNAKFVFTDQITSRN